MKKNTLILLLLFAGLGGAAYYFIKNKDLKNSRTDNWDMQFSIPEARKIITKVRMTDRSGKQSVVEKTKNGWTINGRYPARQSAAELLITTIKNINVKYIPSNAAVPNMMESLAAYGIRVDMFDGENLLKTWYVGGVTPDDRGTYLLMEGSKQPYVGHIPGEESTLRTRFILEEDEWRDRTVLEEKPEEITAISIEYPQYQGFSFNLTKVKQGQYEVTPFYPNQPAIQRTLTRGKAESYLLMFEKLSAEGFENNNYRRDSVLGLVPFANVTIKKTDGSSENVRFYPIYERDLVGNFLVPENTMPFAGQITRYFAYKLPSKDFYLVQHLLFGKIFANYPWFFEPADVGKIKN